MAHKMNANEAETSKATLASNAVQAELLARMNTRIDLIANAEKVTKNELGLISRDLLEYNTVNGSPDVATLNRLISVLTPMNKRTALLFFREFIPHNLQEETFTKRVKDETKYQEIVDRATTFLKDEDNNIWTWAKENVDIEKKPVPFGDRITDLVKQSLTGTKKQEAIESKDVLAAVLAGGVDIADVIEAIKDMPAPEQKVAQAEAA